MRGKVSNVSLLLDEYSIRRPPHGPRVEKNRPNEVCWPAGVLSLGDPQSRSHARYLRRRGFDVGVLSSLWDVRATTLYSGQWNWRVVYPIRSGGGDAVAFQGRAIIDDVTPKYRMTEEKDCVEDPRGFLYGIDQAWGDSVLIVEGVTGVWKLGPGCVATFGIDWKRQQVNKLRRFKKRFVMFDPEDLAQRKAQELANALSLFDGETEVLYGMPHDPGDLLPSEVEEIRKAVGLLTA